MLAQKSFKNIFMNTNSSSYDDLNVAFARLQAIQWDTLGMVFLTLMNRSSPFWNAVVAYMSSITILWIFTPIMISLF